MKVIIVGPVLTEELEREMPNASPAAGKYLRNLMNGFKANNIETKAVGFISLPEASEVIGVKKVYDNITLIAKQKNILKAISMYNREILKNVENEDNVIFYNYRYCDWGLVEKLQIQGIKCTLILADHTRACEETTTVKRIMAKRNEKDYKKFKNVVLLSENARNLVNPHANVKIIEGGINFRDFENIKPPVQKETINLFYAGTFSRVTGVDQLLEAFKNIEDEKYQLYISGRGELEELVIEASKNDNRIHYLGFLTNEEYYKILNDMDVCINPRNMDYEQNQNNFPSKVLEYLASGRVVVSTKFPGWEKFVENFEFVETIKKMNFDKVCNQEKFVLNRRLASQFDWRKQCINMLL